MKKREAEEFGNVSKLIGEWLQSEPIQVQAGEDAAAAFEDGLCPFRKDGLQLRDLKEKVLKRFQSAAEFEAISKRIDGLSAEWKRLGGPDKLELELILEDLPPTIRASEKPKILAAAIVRALDAQDEADLGDLTPPWTLYVIRAASNQALLLEPSFSEWENVLHVVNTTIYELELAEENARQEALFEMAMRSNAFTQGGRQLRQDALGEVLESVVKEYVSEHDKLPQWKEVVGRLETLASTEHKIVQEVDTEAEIIYWRRKGGMEEETTFRQLRERLTLIRKKSSKQ